MQQEIRMQKIISSSRLFVIYCQNSIRSNLNFKEKLFKIKWLPEEGAKSLVAEQVLYYLGTPSFGGQTCQTPIY